jgi:hypothetical protein
MEVQWLSCGKALTCAFELHDMVQAFLMLQEQKYTQLLAELVYLLDILFHLNEVNRKVQERKYPE